MDKNKIIALFTFLGFVTLICLPKIAFIVFATLAIIICLLGIYMCIYFAIKEFNEDRTV